MFKTDLEMYYYQIKQYSDGDIRHEYGKTTFPNSDRKQSILVDFEPCTEQEFKSVAKDYYSKEIENANKMKKYLL